MIYSSSTIDLANFGAYAVTIKGTPSLDVQTINPNSVLFGPCSNSELGILGVDEGLGGGVAQEIAPDSGGAQIAGPTLAASTMNTYETFSHRKLVTFLTCQRRFQLRYRLGLPWPQPPQLEAWRQAALRGKRFHRMLERHFLSLLPEDEGELPAVDRKLAAWECPGGSRTLAST